MTEIASTNPVPTRVRCSDADRERISARLRDAASQGRLTMEELDERLAAVYAAKYHDDLDPVLVDLPKPARTTTGWRAILAMVRVQLILEWMILRGRVDNVPKHRRLVLASVIVLLVLLVAGSVSSALHGFGGDSFERHHGFESPER